jgi:hypothetical protein
MDQEHLDFIMRHQGMLGLPAERCDSEVCRNPITASFSIFPAICR